MYISLSLSVALYKELSNLDKGAESDEEECLVHTLRTQEQVQKSWRKEKNVHLHLREGRRSGSKRKRKRKRVGKEKEKEGGKEEGRERERERERGGREAGRVAREGECTHARSNLSPKPPGCSLYTPSPIACVCVCACVRACVRESNSLVVSSRV